jgi:hypothetical protein
MKWEIKKHKILKDAGEIVFETGDKIEIHEGLHLLKKFLNEKEENAMMLFQTARAMKTGKVLLLPVGSSKQYVLIFLKQLTIYLWIRKNKEA